MLSADPIVNELLTQTLSAISKGSRRLVVWGTDPIGLQFLTGLNALGFLPLVFGLVDHRKESQGRTLFGLQIMPPDYLREVALDTLIITFDKEKEVALELFSSDDTRIPHLVFAGNANYEFTDPVFDRIVSSCPVKSKAGGYPYMLIHLYQCLKHISERRIPGDVAEFGVFQGGTTVFMAKVLKHFSNDCRVYGFDTFQGFPAANHVLDAYTDEKCQFPDYDTVKNYCAPYNIELIRGDIRETYQTLSNVNLALTFFDTDNYSATKKALEFCAERTALGGFVAFDHYFSPGWSQTVGERIAARQVLHKMKFLNLHGTGIFIKQ